MTDPVKKATADKVFEEFERNQRLFEAGEMKLPRIEISNNGGSRVTEQEYEFQRIDDLNGRIKVKAQNPAWGPRYFKIKISEEQ